MKWPEDKTPEQAHTRRTRKAPCTGMVWGGGPEWSTERQGLVGVAWVKGQSQWGRAGLMTKLHRKDKLNQLPSCLMVVQTLGCLHSTRTSILGRTTNSVTTDWLTNRVARAHSFPQCHSKGGAFWISEGHRYIFKWRITCSVGQTLSNKPKYQEIKVWEFSYIPQTTGDLPSLPYYAWRNS